MSLSALDDERGAHALNGTARIVTALAMLAGGVIVAAATLPRCTDLAHSVAFVSPDDPYVQLDREITAEFGMENPVVWVLEAREGTVWTPAILTRLQAMTREVFTIPGVITPDVISLASPNLRDVRVTDDGVEQTYLMGEVPTTPTAIDALRRRIQGDPNFRGTLVSTDGRAAVVVANFRSDADPAALAQAALALRDRYRDGEVVVYVTGAAVLRALGPGAVWPMIPWVTASAGAGLAVLVLTLGARVTMAMLLAALLACVWTVAALAATGAVMLPWTAYALPPTALVAAAVAVAGAGRGSVRVPLSLATAIPAGFFAMVFVTGSPVRAFGLAGGAGAASAAAAGVIACALLMRQRVVNPSPTPWLRPAAIVLVAIAVLGLPRLRASFSLPGYGERYLPATAAADLHAVTRLIRPPTALAVRVRGQPGFVASPGVLHALDGLTEAARADTAVRSTMSLADLVKMVHRTFHENRAEFLAIPDDSSLISRYLTVAYSPGFRRFVDRALATTTVWVYLDSDQARDIGRVVSRLRAQLSGHPVPGAEVDLVGGDGAVILAMERAAKQLAARGVILLLLVALASGALGGAAAFRQSLISGGAAAAFAAGSFGWLALPIDLVSLPCLIFVALAGAAFGALGASGDRDWLWYMSLALVAMAVPALIAPFAAEHLVGMCLLAPAVGALVVPSAPSRSVGASCFWRHAVP
jgi:predicted RND superfamily exporter protein